MSLPSLLRSTTLAALLLLPAPDRLAACAFHTTLPEATVSQQIAGAIEIVAARPAGDNPFRFEPVAVLKGPASDSRPPHLVDSATRMRLARNPGEAVLFARATDGSWTRLLILDAATRPVVDIMLARANEWTTPAGAAERRDTFAGLLAHPDTAIRRLALRELDALPYGVLRDGTYPVSAADLLRGIADIQDMPFAPIRILLLGIADGEAPGPAILGRLQQMADTGTATNLGAWATALIESAGAAGVAGLERLFLSAPGRLTDAQVTEIVRALSVLSADGDPTLRHALDGTTRRLVSREPGAAPLVAQAFGATGDYSQAGLIRELVATRAFTDRQSLMAATSYITRARMAEGTASADARLGQVPVSEQNRFAETSCPDAGLRKSLCE